MHKRLAEAVKKAMKLDMGAPTWTESVPYVGEAVRYTATSTRPEKVVLVDVTVTVTPPAFLHGWEFVATLQNMGGGEVVISTAPGFTAEKWMRDLDPAACQHCGLTRQRKDSFLLKHESGEWKQVGRTCLKDFFPGVSAADIIASATFLFDLASDLSDSQTFGSGGHIDAYDAKLWLTHAAKVIRLHGWKSAKSAGASVNQAAYSYANHSDDDDGPPTAEDAAKADEVLAWLMGLTEAQLDSDYLYNLNVLARVGYARSRNLPLLTSAVQAYNREKGIQTGDSILRPPAAREHVGTVGERGF